MRFGGSVIKHKFKRKIDAQKDLFQQIKGVFLSQIQHNWIGVTWMSKFNKKLMPSLNQISDGLVEEAVVQLRETMGNVKDQKACLEAQQNISKTW